MTSFPTKKIGDVCPDIGSNQFFFVSVEGNPNVHQFGNNSGTFFFLLSNLANKDEIVNQLIQSFIFASKTALRN